MDLEKSYTLQRVERFQTTYPWTHTTSSMTQVLEEFLSSITTPKFFPFSYVAKCLYHNNECYLWFVANNTQEAQKIKKHIENRDRIKITKVYKDIEENSPKEGEETIYIEGNLGEIQAKIREIFFLKGISSDIVDIVIEESTSTTFFPITIRPRELFYMCNGFTIRITSKDTDLTQIKEQVEKIVGSVG